MYVLSCITSSLNIFVILVCYLVISSSGSSTIESILMSLLIVIEIDFFSLPDGRYISAFLLVNLAVFMRCNFLSSRSLYKGTMDDCLGTSSSSLHSIRIIYCSGRYVKFDRLRKLRWNLA